MEPADTDVVTIYNADLKVLEGNNSLNDSLIDLKVKLIISSLPEGKRRKIFAFSSLFYAKLTELKDNKSAHNLVSGWSKSIDIFDLDFIFIPVFLNSHYSLCVVVRPSLLQSSKAIHDTSNLSCLLFMDSLQLHSVKTVGEVITNYLSNEWKAKKCKTSCYNNFNDFENLFQNIEKIECPMPRQNNGYDCGLFVIKYIEEVLNIFPSSTLDDIENKFIPQFNCELFDQKEISLERPKYKNILNELAIKWKNKLHTPLVNNPKEKISKLEDKRSETNPAKFDISTFNFDLLNHLHTPVNNPKVKKSKLEDKRSETNPEKFDISTFNFDLLKHLHTPVPNTI
jgi:hypothetical protein